MRPHVCACLGGWRDGCMHAYVCVGVFVYVGCVGGWVRVCGCVWGGGVGVCVGCGEGGNMLLYLGCSSYLKIYSG